MAERLDGHAVRTVITAGHRDGGRAVDHAGAVHMGPSCGELVVQRIPGGHGLHGGERQSPWHFVLSCDDVLDGEGMLERGRLGHSQVVAGHLGEMGARRCQGAEPELGVLLEVVGCFRGLAGCQVIGCHHHLEALAASQETSVLEHVAAAGMERPEAALAGLVRAAGDFNETVVEGQVVAQGVLPALGVLSVVRKTIHNKLVNFAKWEHLLRTALDSHGGEGNVGVRRFLVAVSVSPGSRHPCARNSVESRCVCL